MFQVPVEWFLDQLPWIGTGAALVVLGLFSGLVRYVPNNRVAIVERLWSLRGSITRGLIALQGEAGFEPRVLRGGVHFFVPFMYRLHAADLVAVPQGAIAYVYARDGHPLAPSQTLAASRDDEDFLDVAAFLAAGGQKGLQRRILREGAHAINIAQFVVLTADRTHALQLSTDEAALLREMRANIEDRDGFEPLILHDAEDRIGIVTIHDGPALPAGELIAPTVGADRDDRASFHNNFQDPERFLAAGGCRGRQYQVLTEGTYYLNRLFASVDLVPRR